MTWKCCSSISFLDLQIPRAADGSFYSNVYRKPAHTYRYLDFQSNHPLCHKLSVVRSLGDRIDTHISKEVDRRNELVKVKDVLRNNNYPSYVLKKNPLHKNKDKVKPRSRIVLPYFKGFSERISRILNKYNVFTIYKPINKLCHFFGLPKDPVEINHVCGVVYKIPCSDCGRQTTLDRRPTAWKPA